MLNGHVVDAVNKNNLDVIERAQFVLCLDPPHPGISENAANVLNIVSNRSLHGNGTADSGCNRWYDHTIQVHVYMYPIGALIYLYLGLP